MESITSIKAKFASSPDTGLDLFIDSYSNDERSGVQSLVKRAIKRRDAYQKELLRIEEMM